LLHRVFALVLASLAGAVCAQEPELQPSAALRCLTHSAGKNAQPDYPFAEFNNNVGGRLQVELTFGSPDRAPKVAILLQQASQRLVDAVLEHLRGLRVPCLEPNSAEARFTQDYIFEADRRQVHWTDPIDKNTQDRAALLGCLTHVSGSVRAPPYPVWALRREMQGRVLARARFVNATDPPEVEVFSRSYATGLADDVANWLKGTRMPCHVGEPLTAMWTYVFVIDSERYGFKELTLRAFLGAAKDIRSQTLAFDTHTMGCPFEVRVQYRQPAMSNAVGEVGPPNPARRPLLEWMAATEFDLNRRSLDSIFGDTAKITVPCLKIDLKPQEKS
jgi:hypothetical protein